MRAGYAIIAAAIGLTVSAGTAPPAVAQTSLTYFAPGNILPNADLGVRGRKVFFPDWTFPLEVGTVTGKHAYIGTQLEIYHHVHDVNSPTLFNYPHRDNQCEPRGWRMLPCPSGNGHQGVDIRADDNRTRDLLAPIDHADTAGALAAERAFLAVLDGSCRMPIGGHAIIDNGRLRFRGMVVKPDGGAAFETTREGDPADAAALGADAGIELKGRAGPDFFAAS